MKELHVLAILGVITLLLVVNGIYRARDIRSRAKQTRSQQSGVVPHIPADPNRFSHLTMIEKGQDQALMVYIKGGSVLQGTNAEIGEFDERPARTITLSPYWIDLKEVSNRQYQLFVERTGHKKPEIVVFFDDITLLFKPDLPVVGVSWFDAERYCAWNGKRLPTEAEWEHAAGGNGQGLWPWGSATDAGYANGLGLEDGFAYTAPVGSYEAGRSPYGLYDMSGNAIEWVSDWYDEFFYQEGQVTLPAGPGHGVTKIIRGGSWSSARNDMRTTKRHSADPYRKEATMGFRCAMSDLSG